MLPGVAAASPEAAATRTEAWSHLASAIAGSGSDRPPPMMHTTPSTHAWVEPQHSGAAMAGVATGANAGAGGGSDGGSGWGRRALLQADDASGRGGGDEQLAAGGGWGRRAMLTVPEGAPSRGGGGGGGGGGVGGGRGEEATGGKEKARRQVDVPQDMGSWIYILGNSASAAQAKRMAALMKPEDLELLPSYN
jgi:hypothetical protein